MKHNRNKKEIRRFINILKSFKSEMIYKTYVCIFIYSLFYITSLYNFIYALLYTFIYNLYVLIYIFII